MISHVFLGSDNLVRAETFYQPILKALGWKLRHADYENGRVIWQPSAGGRPFLILGQPFDGEPASVGNGTMVALLANDQEAVVAAYTLAMSNGACDEGAPGLRPHYHENYFGAYFRDPDGHKICVCCHKQFLKDSA
jgi:catechol 2,3-dioxygenase-like lactoylglutathione lyase family enzyme